MNLDDEFKDEPNTERNNDLIKFTLNNTSLKDGRLVLPALWNDKISSFLPNNYKIAYNILQSVYRKLKSSPSKLAEYDAIFSEQLANGIISEVSYDNIYDKNISYLPHNAVYREDAETTKVRIVYLSNLCERGENNLSHNQISLPGPQMNPKITTSLTLLRFNRYLLVYDLQKAFLQLCLRDEDTSKLNFLWFKDVKAGDFRIVTYRINRVPFGLRFSPFLLMLSLYVQLILHVNIVSAEEREIREMLFNLAYMDNLAYSSSNVDTLFEALQKSLAIFNSFGFKLQKFASNCSDMQGYLKNEFNHKSADEEKLLGLKWRKSIDTLTNTKIYLDPKSNTKRKILATLNANFDPLGFSLPVLNRAKLFLHDLQSVDSLDWDDKISDKKQRSWLNICRQVNNSRSPEVPRYVGDYSDSYDIVGFADASGDFYGCVIYLLDKSINKLSFLCSKNRTINKDLRNKSITILETLAIKLS